MISTKTKQTIVEVEEKTAEMLRAFSELEAMVHEEDNPPEASPKTLPNWLSFAVVAAVAASFGLLAGLSLSGGLF